MIAHWLKLPGLQRLKEEMGYHYLIEVDGGINEETGKLCKDAGVDVLVAGSYILVAIIIKKRLIHYDENWDL